jgi:hypothetical protein
VKKLVVAIVSVFAVALLATVALGLTARHNLKEAAQQPQTTQAPKQEQQAAPQEQEPQPKTHGDMLSWATALAPKGLKVKDELRLQQKIFGDGVGFVMEHPERAKEQAHKVLWAIDAVRAVGLSPDDAVNEHWVAGLDQMEQSQILLLEGLRDQDQAKLEQAGQLMVAASAEIEEADRLATLSEHWPDPQG